MSGIVKAVFPGIGAVRVLTHIHTYTSCQIYLKNGTYNFFFDPRNILDINAYQVAKSIPKLLFFHQHLLMSNWISTELTKNHTGHSALKDVQNGPNVK